MLFHLTFCRDGRCVNPTSKRGVPATSFRRTVRSDPTGLLSPIRSLPPSGSPLPVRDDPPVSGRERPARPPPDLPFLGAFEHQSRAAVVRRHELLGLWRGYRDEFQGTGCSTNLLALIDYLFDRPRQEPGLRRRDDSPRPDQTGPGRVSLALWGRPSWG